MVAKKSRSFNPIAVVGVGAIFPGSHHAHQFWRHIISGKDLITIVPKSHWLLEDHYDSNPAAIDKTYCKRGAFIPDIPFDPLEFGIPPNTMVVIDNAQLLGLVVAKQVLVDTIGVQYGNQDLSRVSVMIGTSALSSFKYVSARMQRPVWDKVLTEAGLDKPLIATLCDRIANYYQDWQENTFPGLLPNVVSGRIANRFNLGGTNCTVDAACASSLAALSMAADQLHLNQADMVITGGIDTLNDIIMYMCFGKTHALSLSGDCRPFSDQADGTILGEGLGLFALKRLADAEANQDKIYAVIKGIGSSSDGRSKSIYAPSSDGQKRAIEQAYQLADYHPHTVHLIEAHGTGTAVGDVAEFTALKAVFAQDPEPRQSFCALGSIKSQIGHTKSAAGAAGLFKAMMALHHKVYPPTIKIDRPNPHLGIGDSPFYLNTIARPWIKNDGLPRRAGVSAFGFGGTNFHVTLEEYQGLYQAQRLRTTKTEFVIFTGRDARDLIRIAEAFLLQSHSLSYFAKTTQTNYDPSHLARLVIIASDVSDLQNKFESAKGLLTTNPKKSIVSKDILYGYALDHGKIAFLFPGQSSAYLNMGAEIAMSFPQALKTWERASEALIHLKPSLHDVVFPPPTFSDVESKQQQRLLEETRFSHAAIAATSLMYHQLLQDLNILPDYVAGLGFGEFTALHAAGVIDNETLFLLTQKPKEIAGDINWSEPETSIFMNSTGKPYASKTSFDFTLMGSERADQFQEMIESMFQSGTRTFLEIGPHHLLSKLIKPQLSDRPCQVMSINQWHEEALVSFWHTLASLFTLGLNPNFSVLWQGFADEMEVDVPKSHVIPLNGANFGSLYPPKKDTHLKDQETKQIPAQSIMSETMTTKNHTNQRDQMTMENDRDELSLIQNLQQQLIEAHNFYQKTMAETHVSFLNSLSEIAKEITGSKVDVDIKHPMTMQNNASIPSPNARAQSVKTNSPPAVAPAMPEHVITQMEPPSAPMNLDKQPAAPLQTPINPQPTALQAPTQNLNLQDMFFTVIAEKTGYPKDMLKREMNIEADLGIDSIQRVEIFSTLTEQFPNLPEIDLTQLAEIQTLGDILRFMEGQRLALTA